MNIVKVHVTSMSKLLSCVQDMFDIIDSYEYREQLLMPKLVITAANDEFFLPTDSRYWWADMLYCTVLYCTVLQVLVGGHAGPGHPQQASHPSQLRHGGVFYWYFIILRA